MKMLIRNLEFTVLPNKLEGSEHTCGARRVRVGVIKSDSNGHNQMSTSVVVSSGVTLDPRPVAS